jgi:hypothetical protein
LQHVLDGPIFEPLRDVNYFRQFRLEGHTLTWPNGAHLAPEYLYGLVRSSPRKNYKALVENRALIQRLLLHLHRYVSDKYEDGSLATDLHHRDPALLLVGAEYSLWRAVFFVYATRDWEHAVEQAAEFLEKVVRDNAINYPQDSATKDWSVGYYLNNAYFRLRDAVEKLEVPEDEEPFKSFLDQMAQGIVETDPIEVWEKAYCVAKKLHEVLGVNAD